MTMVVVLITLIDLITAVIAVVGVLMLAFGVYVFTDPNRELEKLFGLVWIFYSLWPILIAGGVFLYRHGDVVVF